MGDRRSTRPRCRGIPGLRRPSGARCQPPRSSDRMRGRPVRLRRSCGVRRMARSARRARPRSVARAGSTAARLDSPDDERRPPALGEIGGVRVACADAAQVNVHKHLIVARRRHGSVLEASLAIVSQHHRQHLARSAAWMIRRIGRACPARLGRRTRFAYLFSHQHFSQSLRSRTPPGPVRLPANRPFGLPSARVWR
jgi:hypothetical protein